MAASFLAILFLIAVVNVTASFYSIGYYTLTDNSDYKIVNTGAFFSAAPSTSQVADVIARISGQSPLLWESEINLPALSLDSPKIEQPFLLEIHGGFLPSTIKSIIQTTAYENSASALPKVQEIAAYLKDHGIDSTHRVMDLSGGDRVNMLNMFLDEYSRKNPTTPIIVLHYETPSDVHYKAAEQRRVLATSSGNVTIASLSEAEISQYQICLWTGVFFVLLILGSICSVANMEIIPESLLYAKFQSGRTGEKRD